MMMVILHFGLIAVDILIYGKGTSVLWELGLAYVAYYCYMKLSTVAIYGYIALLAVCVVGGVMSIGTMFASTLSLIFYPIHLGLYGFGALFIFRKLKIFIAAEFEYENPTEVVYHDAYG